MIKQLISAILIFGYIFLSTTFSYAVESLSLQIGLGDPINSDSGEYCLKFKELVEKKTEGKVTVTLFPNCVLGEETEMLQNVRRGTLHMTSIGIGNTIPFAPGLGILTLPYFFENDDMVVRGTTGAVLDKLNETAVKQGGFRILGFSYASYRYLTNSVRPVTKLADLKGLKIRVPQNPIFIETYTVWGANPVPMSWSETFTALQQRVVDAQDNPYIVNHSKKMEEVQSYLTEVHYQYSLLPLIYGERFFQKLSPELQKILTDSAQEAQAYILTWQNENSLKARQAMEAKGLKVSTLTDEQVWRDLAVQNVWPKFYDDLGGKAYVDEFIALIK